jgi:hypothetical protein
MRHKFVAIAGAAGGHIETIDSERHPTVFIRIHIFSIYDLMRKVVAHFILTPYQAPTLSLFRW